MRSIMAMCIHTSVMHYSCNVEVNGSVVNEFGIVHDILVENVG